MPDETHVASREQEHLEAIKRARQLVAKRQAKVDDIAAALKEAKAALETATNKLMEEIDFEMPLFDAANPSQATPTVSPVDADDESWRDVDITELGLSDSIVEKLIAAELTTIGKIADYTGNTNSTDPLQKIAGIGATSAEKIATAIDRYWAEHPRKPAVTDEPVQDETTESEPDEDLRDADEQ